MSEQAYTYVIVGGGLAGASAVQGIREHDTSGSILLLGSENHLPYDRPPLSKQLWLGKKKVEDIFPHGRDYYDQNGVQILLGTTAAALDPRQKAVTGQDGRVYRYEKLLLATGGTPRPLPTPGGNLSGLSYYHYLDDYLQMRNAAREGMSALVIGGGFIGSELAAALNANKLDVTMVFPEDYLCARVFPQPLGQAVQRHYRERGVHIVQDVPVSFAQRGERIAARTKNGQELEADLVIVGIGISPEVRLAQAAGLQVDNGIVVNEYLQSSDPDIYAAGDNAHFPYQALGKAVRIEHWDNAVSQGRWAGSNMAGAHQPFTYMPYFYSDLFEFGYEAVGDVDSRLQTWADWQKENDTGVVYYLQDGKVRGVMLCNVWGKLDAARELIRRGEPATADTLRGAIR